jgi:hypothetical protein
MEFSYPCSDEPIGGSETGSPPFFVIPKIRAFKFTYDVILFLLESILIIQSET